MEVLEQKIGRHGSGSFRGLDALAVHATRPSERSFREKRASLRHFFSSSPPNFLLFSGRPFVTDLPFSLGFTFTTSLSPRLSWLRSLCAPSKLNTWTSLSTRFRRLLAASMPPRPGKPSRVRSIKYSSYHPHWNPAPQLRTTRHSVRLLVSLEEVRFVHP